MLSKPKPPFGLRLNEDQWLYFFTLTITIVLFVLAWNLLRGRVGRAIVAIRDNHIAAEAMGVDNALYKSTVFGVRRGLYGHRRRALRPRRGVRGPRHLPMSSCRSSFLTGIVIGGLATISGAVFGALFIQFIRLGPGHLEAAPWPSSGSF